jgi:hypothetical protein
MIHTRIFGWIDHWIYSLVRLDQAMNIDRCDDMTYTTTCTHNTRSLDFGPMNF